MTRGPIKRMLRYCTACHQTTEQVRDFSAQREIWICTNEKCGARLVATSGLPEKPSVNVSNG